MRRYVWIIEAGDETKPLYFHGVASGASPASSKPLRSKSAASLTSARGLMDLPE